MKKILIVSKLPIWSMQKNRGSKSIQQTLVGYAKNGYEVHYLTSSNASSCDIDDAVITVQNFRLPLKNLKSDRRLIKLLILKLQVVFFYIFGIINTLKYAKLIEPDVLYGFEVHGAFVTSITSRILNIPNINRFMGTILANKLDSGLNRILYFDHFLGLKARARMRIMTNDGTKGDEVLKRLNSYDSNTLFLLNGVDVKSLDGYPSADDIRNSFGISKDKIVFLTVSR
ncbi:MAG: hypothetical protein H5T96_09860, partial [Tissierellales bacterium]|nr:hypothetical protein [Tissierellales bacterium]